MKSTMTLQVPTDTLLKLIGQLRARGGSHDLSAVIPPACWAIATPPPRDPSPGEGWNLPERRKFRFRLEDVGFD